MKYAHDNLTMFVLCKCLENNLFERVFVFGLKILTK